MKSLQMYLTLVIFLLICIGKSLECSQRNTSCNSIKTDDGFKFLYGGQEGNEIFVYDNETVIAHAVLDNQSFTYLNEVVSGMDNHSIVTRDCRNLKIKCIVPYGSRFVKETCMDYKIIEKMKSPDPRDSPTRWDKFGLFGVLFGAVMLTVIIGKLYYHYGKKRVNEIPSAPDPRGSDENYTEQDITLGSVHVHSIDPTADGKTPQSLSLDHNLNNEGNQPSENGDVSAPDVNRASNHRAMHRNLRDDPGGVNDNKGKDILSIRETHSGWTLVNRGPEDHENERQILLNQRAVIQGFDMTGEAAVLVNKCSFDPDEVSKCSTAPDNDVESSPKMKN